MENIKEDNQNQLQLKLPPITSRSGVEQRISVMEFQREKSYEAFQQALGALIFLRELLASMPPEDSSNKE